MSQIFLNVSALNQSQIKNYVQKTKFFTKSSLNILERNKNNATDAHKLLKFNAKIVIWSFVKLVKNNSIMQLAIANT